MIPWAFLAAVPFALRLPILNEEFPLVCRPQKHLLSFRGWAGSYKEAIKQVA